MTRTSKEFEELRQLHESILRSAGEGIYGLAADGRANFANAAAQEILGWTEQDLVGEYIHEFHHHSYADGSHYPKEACPIYAALRDGKVHRDTDEVFWHKDGHAIPVEYVSTPVWTDGKIAGAVVVFKNISARKNAERDRREALDEINRLKLTLERERDYLRDEMLAEQRFGDIVGRSAPLRHMLAQIDAVAETNATVLILGETGVGKELVAREIHRRSQRSNKVMVKANCAAIPNDLFESEFFGHARGAFTGAHTDRVGRFQLADRGTLFMDEVGDIPLHLQSKLLRALQEQEFERVGEERTRKVDVRVIAATNRDMKMEVAAGRFREDLFYRLSVFPIEVPPLRERKDDIIPLALHFLEQNSAELQKPNLQLTREQGRLLTGYPWPGNVRELQHVSARAAIQTSGKKLMLDSASLGNISSIGETRVESSQEDSREFLSDSEVRKLERDNLLQVLKLANWRVSGNGGAANMLGIKPTTLEYRMRKFNITRPRNY